MNIKTVKVELRSKVPMLMHRYTGEKPSKAKRAPGSKTQEYLDEIHKSDWMEGAYFDRGMFHIPPEVLESALSEGARKNRKGKAFQKGLMVEDDFIPLIVYDAEFKNGRILKGALEDFYVPEYIDLRGVRIKQVRVDRCRPIFRFWSLSFTVRFDAAEAITPADVKEALENACLCDYRPRFGRFNVFKFENGEAG